MEEKKPAFIPIGREQMVGQKELCNRGRLFSFLKAVILICQSTVGVQVQVFRYSINQAQLTA